MRIGPWLVAALLALALAPGCSPRGGEGAAAPSVREVQEFHSAVVDDDAIIVERLLTARPALVNARNEQGQTPLQVANQRGAHEAANVLRDHGAEE
ncbi:MAG TPA: ankyrin repeat domain-containing protein [Chthonomonadales bacterium]|nr:ankyrin repeat domain-containing protein [Chthonomonadales bacterium]